MMASTFDTTVHSFDPRYVGKYKTLLFNITMLEHDSISSDITLRPKRNGRYFAGDIFKRTFYNGNCIVHQISLKCVVEVH